MTTETPKRERPTMARLRELEAEVRNQQRYRQVAEQRVELVSAENETAIAERDAERAKWEQFDAEALALGQIIGPLERLESKERGQSWQLDSDTRREQNQAVAASVARVLVIAGARFGVELSLT